MRGSPQACNLLSWTNRLVRRVGQAQTWEAKMRPESYNRWTSLSKKLTRKFYSFMRRPTLRTEIACNSRASIRSRCLRSITATYRMHQGHLRGILSGHLCPLGSQEDLHLKLAHNKGLSDKTHRKIAFWWSWTRRILMTTQKLCQLSSILKLPSQAFKQHKIISQSSTCRKWLTVNVVSTQMPVPP